jgi:hypothetical protein
VRFFVTFTLTTTMVATGAFGAIPDNPVTITFQEEIEQNVPEPFLEPLNSYLDVLSVPTLPAQPATQPVPLDLVGLLLPDTTSETSAALQATATEAVIGTATITETQILSPTMTASLIRTPSPTPTRTPTSTNTLTATATLTCSPPSTDFANTTFFNSSTRTINVYWFDLSCRIVLTRTLNPGDSYIQNTYLGHLWQFRDTATQEWLANYVVSAASEVVNVATGVVTIATATPTVTVTPTSTATSPAAPTTAAFVGFFVSAVDLNGAGSVVPILPGESVVVTYNFQVFSDPCPGCITQLVTGLGSPGSHGGFCAYDGVPGIFPGDSGSEEILLTAPVSPGTYNVIVEYHWQFTCADALTNYGTGGAVPRQVIGQIIVP